MTFFIRKNLPDHAAVISLVLERKASLFRCCRIGVAYM